MKLCIDCVFYIAPFCSQGVAARLQATTAPVNPVDGTPMPLDVRLDRPALIERQEGRCGKDATLFKPKPDVVVQDVPTIATVTPASPI